MKKLTKKEIWLAFQDIAHARNHVLEVSLSWHEARKSGKDKQGVPFGNVCSLLEQAVEELISAQATWSKVEDQMEGSSPDEVG